MFETIFLAVFGIVVAFYLYLFVGYLWGEVKRLRFWLQQSSKVVIALLLLLIIALALDGKILYNGFYKPFF